MPIAISTLMPEARLELPGIPEPVLEAAVARNVRKFLWESEGWVYTYDNALDWTAGQQTVPSPTPGVDIPDGCIVKRVDTIKYGSDGVNHTNLVNFRTRDALDRYDSSWWSRTGSTPLYWTAEADGTAIITPIAEATVTTALLIRAVIVLARNVPTVTDTLPDNLYYENEEAMRAGVLWELMKMPGRDWTNPDLAGVYKGIYEGGVRMAKSRAAASYGQPKEVMSYGGIAGSDFAFRDDYGSPR